MTGRFALCLATLLGLLAAAASASTARAQEPDCRFYKVAVDQVNMFDEPRAISKFMAALEKNEIVCVVGDQQVGDRVWAYVAYELRRQNERRPTEGWVVMNALQRATDADLAAVRAITGPRGDQATTRPRDADPPPVTIPDQAAAPPRDEPTRPRDDVVRFTEGLMSAPPPLTGRSLEQLIAGVPTFPPIEGLPDNVWKKTCNNCHQWNQQTLCTQAGTYVKDPKMAFRVQHPYGGPEKTALMKWAEGGCQ
jgi:hypothetical protein